MIGDRAARDSAAGFRVRLLAMDINQAVVEAERLVTGFTDGGKQAREVRVRPSGDDADHIKVWVDLGPGVDDDACAAWAERARAALAKAIGAYTVEVRAESL